MSQTTATTDHKVRWTPDIAELWTATCSCGWESPIAANAQVRKAIRAHKDSVGIGVRQVDGHAHTSRSAEPTNRLTVLDPNEIRSGAWMEVHAEGCSHRVGRNTWKLQVSNLVEAAEVCAGDFIGESMTVDEAIDQHIYWAPCVHLPRNAA